MPIVETLWLHGSPEELSTLRVGSTTTPDERLARVFSHKPTLMSVSDDGTIAHNGHCAGMLHRVSEAVGADDLVPVPHSTIGEGQESAHRAPAAHRRHCASADRPG